MKMQWFVASVVKRSSKRGRWIALGCLVFASVFEGPVSVDAQNTNLGPAAVRAPALNNNVTLAAVSAPLTNGVDGAARVSVTAPAQQEIRLVADGAVADYGLQKVQFPADLTEAPIRITTPDGRELAVRATFLALQDVATGQSLLLGEVRPSEGELVGENTVLYPNAFDTIAADVRYRYTKHSLEQDIIIHENIRLPVEFAPENVRLEVWSEWIESVPDRKETVAVQLRPSVSGKSQPPLLEADEQPKFGAARIGAGYAFGLQSEAEKLPVAKTFSRIEGRDWLVERVDFTAIQARLEKLPQRQAQAQPQNFKSDPSQLIRSLQAHRPVDGEKTMRLAQFTPPQQDSVVLDFIIYSSIPVPANVISWWPGAGAANDVYGINSGTAYGGVSYGAGKVGQAFTFNGSGHVRLPHDSSLDLTWQLTVEAWIKPTSVAAYQSILSKWAAVGGNTQKSFDVGLNPGGQCSLLASPGGTDAGATFVLSSNAVPVNEWTHIAVVADGSTLRVYLNGVLDGEGEYYSGIYPGVIDLGIGGVVGGAAPGTAISRFSGSIDELAIYARDLGGSEIQSLYEAGVGGKINPAVTTVPDDLAAWWPGDAHGYDLAGNHHATINGLTYEGAVVSAGFKFSGLSSTDGAVVADAGILNLGSGEQLTIEAWINAGTHTTSYGVMSIAGKRYAPDLTSALGYEFFLINGALAFQIANGGGVYNFTTSGDLRNTGWRHVAVTLDRSTSTGGKFYVDGTSIATFNPTVLSGSLSNGMPFLIGRHPSSWFNGKYKGLIDEVAVYKRALSASEITALYAAGSAGKAKSDVDDDGLPDWWEWLHFGELGQGPNDDYDGDGILNQDEYANGWDPNTIAFQARFENLYVSNRVVQGECELTLGQPYEMAVLTNTTELTGANWTSYQPNFTLTLPDDDGDHLVLVALRGRAATIPPEMDFTELTLDRVPPVLCITNPALAGNAGTVLKPYLQLQGYADEPLASLAYDITNEFGLLTNEHVSVVDQYFDTNKFDFTTNWFQGYDIALATNLNLITLRVADRAGNVTTTNIAVTLDWSTDNVAPVVVFLWPTNEMHLSGASFYVRGRIDDETASVLLQSVNANNETNQVVGIVERNGMFWVEDLPLAAGVNEWELIATDAAGNVSRTNLSVVPSSVVLTITSTPEGTDLYEPVGTVYGTISDPDYTVTVNGAAAEVDEYGNWYAVNVPNQGQGTATFDAVASPSGGGGGGGANPPVAVSAQKEHLAEVRITEHHSKWSLTSPGVMYAWTKDFSGGFVPGLNGSPTLKYQATATHRFENDTDWSLDTYRWSDADSSGTVVSENTSGSTGPWPISLADSWVKNVPEASQAHFEGVNRQYVWQYFAKGVRHTWPNVDGSETVVVCDATTTETLYTGGKAASRRKNLFCLTATATEYKGRPQTAPWGYTPGYAVDPGKIEVKGKAVGNDSRLYVALPDNTPEDVTVNVKGANHFNAGVGPTKYKSYFTAFVTMPNPGGPKWQVVSPEDRAGHCWWRFGSDAPIEGLLRMGVPMGTAVYLNKQVGYFPIDPVASIGNPTEGILKEEGNGDPNVWRIFRIGFDELVSGLNFTYDLWYEPGDYGLGLPFYQYTHHCVSTMIEAGGQAGVALPDESNPQGMGVELGKFPTDPDP